MIMPYLLVKIKEVFKMSLQEELLDLDSAANRHSQGVNALGLMAMGLSQEDEQYADGFTVLYRYMLDANRDIRKYLDNCLYAIQRT